MGKATSLPYTKEWAQLMEHRRLVPTKCGVDQRDQKVPLWGGLLLWLSGTQLIVYSILLAIAEILKAIDNTGHVLYDYVCNS